MISLGTNSTRLLVVDVEPDGRLVERYHEAVLTRLGEGLGASGNLSVSAVERTLDVVRRYALRVRDEGAETVAIATSAVRRADDGDAFRERFRTIAGVELRILAGEEEARYSYLGAIYGTDPTVRTAVLDIGGGSTECAVGMSEVEEAVSVEIGAVRLTEMFPPLAGRHGADAARTAHDEARAYVNGVMAPKYANLRADRMLAVAGTPRTLGAMVDATSSNGPSTELTVQSVIEMTDLLIATPYEARRSLPGMTPERADILLAGATILTTASGIMSVDGVTIISNDLLLGYLSCCA